ncbi:MAG: cbb3-type cytochrome c oxidase subunit 3 [Steroidobacteraceae bacterium]|jgi:cytochrome c oxidase cbb3-type subunit 4|nr:cbb3-type cytochrome c oxidase subunit 3 [Steroidobacteraceae bacterium]
MEAGTLRGLWTLLALIAFVGVTWWAWSGRRRERFEEASRLPLEEDPHKNEDK